MTLTQLRYFVAAAARHSMTEAAAELHVAQSAVSASIALLERTLKVQLFVRQRSKGLALTEAGKQLLLDARSVLAQVDEMADAVRGRQHEVGGTLRLACFVTLAPFVLPRLISRVKEEHPELRVEVIEADAEQTAELVLRGEVELAIAYNFEASQDLTFEELYAAPPHVIVSSDHRLARRPEVRLKELVGEDLVLLDIRQSREYFLGLLRDAGLDPAIPYSSRSYETVRSLVARGDGYSILNHVSISPNTYDGGELAALPIADDVESLRVCLASVRGVRPTARARAVAAVARELYGEGH